MSLVTEVLINFVKPDILDTITNRTKLMQLMFYDIKNQVSDQKLAIGVGTKEVIHGMKMKEDGSVEDSDLKAFFLSVRAFYNKAIEKLLDNIPLNCEILKCLQFLDPVNQKKEICLEYLQTLAMKMKGVITEEERNELERELRLYALSDVDDKLKENQMEESYCDIAKFWTMVLATENTGGGLRYGTLAKLVKVLMSLGHGNSNTERSFSQTELT